MRFDFLKKLIIGVLLIAISGFAAYYVKDYLDRQDPQYAIPQITVKADLQPVPAVVGGYDWQFAFGERVESLPDSIFDIVFEEIHLKGGEELSIDFSVDPVSYSIKRSDAYSYHFFEIPIEGVSVPFESGGYTYEVVASFEDGTALYYFYIVV